MAKKLLGVLTVLALLGGVLSGATASAQEAEPTAGGDPFACGELFTDPADDVEQGNLDLIRGGIAATDGASFTATLQAKNLTTEVPTDATGIVWYFWWTYGDVNRFASATYSLFTDEVTYGVGETNAAGQLTTTGATEGTFTEGEGGTITILVPYESVGGPAAGDVLTQVYAESRVRLSGPAGPGFVSPIDRAPDGEAFGTDFTAGSCAAGGPVVDPGDPPTVEPPVKKGCKKGKGKKKGCKKPACPAFTPAEAGVEAPLTKVTDAATEEAPIEIPIAAESGTPVAGTHVFHNLQVDSKSKDAGLYVRYEFPTHEDLDLYLYNSDGSTAAQAAGFNPFPFIPHNDVFFTDGTGTGGHSEQGAEQVDGVLTPDCGGYTADLAQYLSEGGEMLLKVWLGPATWDPVAQAPIENEG